MQAIGFGLGLSQHQFKLIIIAIMALLSLIMLKKQKGQQKCILNQPYNKEDANSQLKKE
jgi:hypothetical protein